MSLLEALTSRVYQAADFLAMCYLFCMQGGWWMKFWDKRMHTLTRLPRIFFKGEEEDENNYKYMRT